MKKNIAIISGGNSSEYIISVKSAETIVDNIDKSKYNPYLVHLKGLEWDVQINGETIPVNKSNFTFTLQNESVTFDCVIIMIHGAPGEDGKLQGYFDMLNIPYTTSGVMASSLSFNKYFTKLFLKQFDIKSANEILVKKGEEPNIIDISDKLGFPCFVKPNNAGSSFGVSKISSAEELKKAIDHAFTEDTEVLIEEFIEGTEVTSGIVKTGTNEYLLPVTEIVSDTSFFDFEAKYQGKSKEITPARLSDDLTREIQQLTSKVFNALSCKGIARVDYIIKNNIPYFLEINTIPGMSAESIIPQQLRTQGLSLTNILTELIESNL